MINSLFNKVTPTKAPPNHRNTSNNDDDGKNSQETKITPQKKQTTLSYASVAQNSSKTANDAMTKTTTTTNDHDDTSSGNNSRHLIKKQKLESPGKANKPTKQGSPGKDMENSPRKLPPNTENINSDALESQKPMRKTSKRGYSPKKPNEKTNNDMKTKVNTINSMDPPTASATKPWLDKVTLAKLHKEPDGAPKNLDLNDGGWLQGIDICAAGIKCCVRKSVSLSTKHRCAACGWCLHKQCGIAIKVTRQHEKDNIYKTTKIVNSICLLCISKKKMHIDKPGSVNECVSTKYQAVSSNIKFKWEKITLATYNSFLPKNTPEAIKNRALARAEETRKDLAHWAASQQQDQQTKTPSSTSDQLQPPKDDGKEDNTMPYGTINFTDDNSSTEEAPMIIDANTEEHPRNIAVEEHIREPKNISPDDDDNTIIGGNPNTEPSIGEHNRSNQTKSSVTTSGLYMDVQLILPSVTKKDPSTLIANLSKRLKDWITSIQTVVPTFRLHTVDPEHEEQTTLHAIKDLEWTKLTDIKKFFRGATPEPKRGRLFLRVKASFDGTTQDLLTNVGWFHKTNNEILRIASLQCFKSQVLGFLLYTLRHTDETPLIEAVKQHTDKPVSMRWMRIADGSKYDPDRDTSEDPKAIHIETAAEDADEVKEILRTIWGSTCTEFPLGTRYRFVSARTKLLGTDSITKFEAMKNRQEAWIAQHGGIIREDISAIDATIAGTNTTLRQVLMTLPARSGKTTTPLIYAIDRRWNKVGFNFSFHPEKLDEGCRTVKGLIPILLNKYTEEQIRPFFSIRAMIEGKRLEYDPITGNVISMDDKELQAIFDEDDEMASLKPSRLETSTEDFSNRFGQRHAQTLTREREDDDTISTMGDGAQKSMQPKVFANEPVRAPVNEINQNDPKNSDTRSTHSRSTASSLSLTSRHTFHTRISAMESNFGGMTNDVHAMQANMNNLTAQMTNLTNLIQSMAQPSATTTNQVSAIASGVTTPQAPSDPSGTDCLLKKATGPAPG